MNLFQRKSEPQEVPPRDADKEPRDVSGTAPSVAPFEVLAHGFLTGKPERREDRRGKFYVVGHMTIDCEPKLYMAFTCFNQTVGQTLQRMDAGDALTIQGPLTIFQAGTADQKFSVNARRMLSNFRQVKQPERN